MKLSETLLVRGFVDQHQYVVDKLAISLLMSQFFVAVLSAYGVPTYASSIYDFHVSRFGWAHQGFFRETT